MQYRLIQTVEGRMLRTDGEMANAIVAFEARGYQHTGFNHNTHNRAELQGQPTFEGLAGPMWDGPGYCELSRGHQHLPGVANVGLPIRRP